ncbi:hypothetical protein QQ045_026575 [Rhodiola kirilowii]
MASYHFTNLEPGWSNVRELCSSFCNGTVNDTGFCPSPCLPECPATCQYALTPPDSNAIYTLDPFIIATFACLAVGLLAMCSYAIYCLRRRSQSRPGPGQEAQVVGHVYGESNSAGLQVSAVCAIKIQKYRTGDDLFREMECAVCLNEFQDGELLRIMPKCNHTFHKFCVDVWLGSHVSCPMCRACIVPHIALAPASEHHISPV